MNIKEAIKNIDDLKEQALEIRLGMNYKETEDIFNFCRELHWKLGELEAFHCSWQQMARKEPLTLADIDTAEKREAIRKQLLQENTFVSRIENPETFVKYPGWQEDVAAINSTEIEHYKQLMKENGLGSYIAMLKFTPGELSEIAAALPEMREYAGDLCMLKSIKDQLSNEKLFAMWNNNEPLEIYSKIMKIISEEKGFYSSYIPEIILLKIREMEGLAKTFADIKADVELTYSVELAYYKKKLTDINYISKLTSEDLAQANEVCNAQVGLCIAAIKKSQLKQLEHTVQSLKDSMKNNTVYDMYNQVFKKLNCIDWVLQESVDYMKLKEVCNFAQAADVALPEYGKIDFYINKLAKSADLTRVERHEIKRIFDKYFMQCNNNVSEERNHQKAENMAEKGFDSSLKTKKIKKQRNKTAFIR